MAKRSSGDDVMRAAGLH